MATTYGKVIVEPRGRPCTVTIKQNNSSGSAVTAYTAKDGSTAHTFPKAIRTRTEFHISSEIDRPVWVSVACDGVEQLGGGSGLTVPTLGRETCVSVGLDPFELDDVTGQYERYVASLTTANATPVALGIGNTTVIPVDEDETVFIHALVVARRTAADNESAAYRLFACFDRNTSGNVTAVGSATITAIEDTAGWDCAFAADTSAQGVNITVTGGAYDVKWKALCTVIRVKG